MGISRILRVVQKVLLLGPAGPILSSIPKRAANTFKKLRQEGLRVRHLNSVHFGWWTFLLAWLVTSERRRRKRKSVACATSLLTVLSNEALEDVLLQFVHIVTKSTATRLPNWIRLDDVEDIAWFNTILFQLWPYVDSAFFAPLGLVIQPLLDNAVKDTKVVNKLVLDSLTLGREAPHLQGLRVSRDSLGAFEIELSLRWNSSPDVKLLVYSNLMNAGLVPATATLSNLSISGEFLVRVVKKTNSEDIAGISLTLAEPLVVSYSVRFSVTKGFKGMKPQAIPGLYSLLQNLVADLTAKYMTFPKSLPIFINATNAEENKEIQQLLLIQSKYKVAVKICSGRRLPKFNRYYLAYDTSLKFEGNEKLRKLRRKTEEQKGENPCWNHEDEVQVYSVQRQRLLIILYGKKTATRWIPIAKTYIPLAGIRHSEEAWYSLYSMQGRGGRESAHQASSKGEIRVRLSVDKSQSTTGCSECRAYEWMKLKKRKETLPLSRTITLTSDSSELELCSRSSPRLEKIIKGIPRQALSWIDEPEACTTRNFNRCLEFLWPTLEHHFALNVALANQNIFKGVFPFASLKLEKCTLGSFSPTIVAVRHHASNAADAIFDIDLISAGDQEIVFSISPLGNPLAKLSFSMQQIQLVAKLRVGLSTLMPVAPAIGTISISSVGVPHIDFNLGIKLSPLIPTIKVSTLPGIGMLRNAILKSLVTRFVAHPAKIEIPLVNFSNPRYRCFGAASSMPDGFFHINIVRCVGVMSKDNFCGLSLASDPYVVVLPGNTRKPYNERSMKTRVIHQNLNPEWNESFSFLCESIAGLYIVIGVFDLDIGQEIRHYVHAEKTCKGIIEEVKDVRDKLLRIQPTQNHPLDVDWSSTIVDLRRRLQFFMRKLHGVKEDDPKTKDPENKEKPTKTDIDEMLAMETGVRGNDFLGCTLLHDLAPLFEKGAGTITKTIPLSGGGGASIELEMTYYPLSRGVFSPTSDTHGTIIVELGRLEGVNDQKKRRPKTYIVFEVSNGTRQVSSTKKGADPAWYETFVFQNLTIAEIRDDLRVKVLRRKRMSDDRLLGNLSISLIELTRRKEMHGRWSIGLGLIELSIAWFKHE